MALHQAARQALDHAGRTFVLAIEHVDFHHPVAVEQLQRQGCRDVGGIVDVKAQHLPLGRQHADHAEAHAAEAHFLAQRVGVAEQRLRQGVTQHHRRARGDQIVLGHELAARQGHAPHLGRLRADAEGQGAAAFASEFGGQLAADHRGHGLHAGDVAQALRIVQGQRALSVDHADRHARGVVLAGHHGDQMRAELGELADEIALQAGTEAGEQHHGGDAHRNRQHGEQGTLTLGQQALQGETSKISGTHINAHSGQARDQAVRRGGRAASRTAVPRPAR